ncbi:hypothetical protein UPYG_G00017740 [Umbra pygmaea]|uniref:Ig-like domain-containing protein n=1 Tax=Umbra pygmaea TaxID=75934 RepID=A0ABD0XYQ6_UMBPY
MASQKGIISVVLLCLVIATADALNVDIPQPLYEFARGDNITIPCNFKIDISNPKSITINWKHQSTPGLPEVAVLSYYFIPGTVTTTENDDNLDVDDAYSGRAFLDHDITNGKANLKLNSINLQDNQVFECQVQIPKDQKGKTADTTQLVVLVAPSVPVIKVVGTSEYGQNINLTCQSAEGSPTPTYKWQSYDVQNTPRAPLPKTIENNGVLSLFNITKDFSGYYICTATNKIRSASYNMTLVVLPPSMNIASTAGIIGAVVAAILVLIIIIYCCCCRKKKEEPEYEMAAERGEVHEKEAIENSEERRTRSMPDNDERPQKIVNHEQYQERSKIDLDHRSEYDDRRGDYDDRRSDYDDRRDHRDDRRDNYDRYGDRREHYDSDRGYDERSERGRYSDRYDEPYDDHERPPSVPANKPTKPAKNLKPSRPMDYDD